jgi:hypothetical protein
MWAEPLRSHPEIVNAAIMEMEDYDCKFFEGVVDTGHKSVAGIPIYCLCLEF